MSFAASLCRIYFLFFFFLVFLSLSISPRFIRVPWIWPCAGQITFDVHYCWRPGRKTKIQFVVLGQTPRTRCNDLYKKSFFSRVRVISHTQFTACRALGVSLMRYFFCLFFHPDTAYIIYIGSAMWPQYDRTTVICAFVSPKLYGRFVFLKISYNVKIPFSYSDTRVERTRVLGVFYSTVRWK